MYIPIIDGLVKAFTSWREGRVKIKAAKLETKLAAEKAKQKRFLAEVNAETSWDLAALRASERSWKDEWLTIILSAPFVGAFIPVVQDHVLVGFQYLNQTPHWYQMSFLGVVAASFGLRWWFTKRLNPS